MKQLDTYGLKYNPFPMLPIAGEPQLRLFVDREDELERAATTVLLGKSLLVTGQYGIGKTSFIYALRQRIMRKVPLTLFMDVRLPFDAKDANSLLVALALELERNKTPESSLTLDRMKQNQEYFNVITRASLDDLLSVTKESINKLTRDNKRLVFVLDDVDKMSIRLNMLAGIRDQLWKMNVVFIISSSLDQYGDMRNSAMEPFFSVVELRGFNEPQTKMLIDKRLQDASNNKLGIREFMFDGVIHKIYQFSQGNPRTILKMCYDAFNRSSLRNSKIITDEDLSNFVQEELSRSTLLESRILSILSRNPEGMSVSQIHEALLKENPITRSRVSQVLGDFKTKGFVKFKKQGRFSIYSEVIPLKENPE